MIYGFLKPLVVSCTRQFFRDIQVKGEPHEEGPLIIAANHPNVMLDALLIIGSFRRPLWFIVKATIFKGYWVNWFLRWIHFTPVHRRQDEPDSTEKNTEALRDVTAKLREGVAFIIFPEGDSRARRWLKIIKTGAARIALQTEDESDFAAGVKIQPVGITYSDFFRFNSSVTVEFGTPIDVSKYKESYKNDSAEAITELTAEIAEQMRHLTVEVRDVRTVDLVEMVDRLYHSKGILLDDKDRLIMVKEKLDNLLPKNEEKLNELRIRLMHHLDLASAMKLDGSEDLDAKIPSIFMMLITPFIFIGIITLFIPFKLSFWISRKMSKRKSQYSSWAVSSAFFLFPLWCILFGVVVAVLTHNFWYGLLSIFLIVSCGYFTSKYFSQLAVFIFTMIWPSRKNPIMVMRMMRDELIREIEALN